MVSAVKVGGRRLHELARQGLEVERAARPVTVYRFDVEPDPSRRRIYRAEIECSSGTYVRVLAQDLGARARRRGARDRPAADPDRFLRRRRDAAARRTRARLGVDAGPSHARHGRGHGRVDRRRLDPHGARPRPGAARCGRGRAVGDARRQRARCSPSTRPRAPTASGRRWCSPRPAERRPAPSERVPSGAMPGPGTAVTIGAYDGVHLGHRALLRDLSERAAAEGLSTVVVTFDRHPAAVVRPDSAPKQLTSLEQKLELLAECGIDRTLVVPFDEARADETAEEFVQEILVDQLGARLVVVGEDFHFGHGRKGNVDLLRRLGAEHGFEVVGVGLTGDESEAVSSTRIRALIAAGDVAGGGPTAGTAARGAGPGGAGRRAWRSGTGVPDGQRGRGRRHRPAGGRHLRRLPDPGRRFGAPERHLGGPAADLLRAGHRPGAGRGLPARFRRRPLRGGGPGVLPGTPRAPSSASTRWRR